MSNLTDTIKNIQRSVGVNADGIFGSITAKAVLSFLNHSSGIEGAPEVVGDKWKAGLDDRTIANIETLDPKCRDQFAKFMRLAKATAAAMGFDYVMISGNRTFAEQDQIFKQAHDGKDNDHDGKTDEADEKVTKARGGFSNHNFGVAGDCGVFWGKVYLDNHSPKQAARVHHACAVHAHGCGLEWGGDWPSFPDLPHYEVASDLTMEEKRAIYSKKGSIL